MKHPNGLKNPIIVTIASFVFILVVTQQQIAYGFTDQVIQRGATGEDVVELQARLQYIGFYNGKINGVFDWATYWAVRNYQEQFGMKVDGLVGKQMKASLERTTEYRKDLVNKALTEGRKFTHYGGVDPFEKQVGHKGSADTEKKAKQQKKNEQAAQNKNASQNERAVREGGKEQNQNPTPKEEKQTQNERTEITEAVEEEESNEEATIEKAMNVPAGFSENDIQLMAQTVYGEARGEPYIGQVAIAAVILNRLNSPIFPNTVSGVIFEPQAFTAVADGQIYNTPDESARKAVLDAINGQDPTGGATYYFNPATATNAWIWSRPQIKKIGKHIFCN